METENSEVEYGPANLENISYLEESDDEITAERALQALENAWLNEKFSPELLPHQLELVECMLEQISHMEDNLKRLVKEICIHQFFNILTQNKLFNC
jgi:hypothetical protein